MITYEVICSRNQILYAALEAISQRIIDNHPEGEEAMQLLKRKSAIRREIEVNLRRLDIMGTLASDYLPPRADFREHQTVRCSKTSQEWHCIYSAAKAMKLDEGYLRKMLTGESKNWTSLFIPGAKKEIAYY